MKSILKSALILSTMLNLASMVSARDAVVAVDSKSGTQKLFWREDQTIFTKTCSHHELRGTTRQQMIESCSDPVKSMKVKRFFRYVQALIKKDNWYLPSDNLSLSSSDFDYYQNVFMAGMQESYNRTVINNTIAYLVDGLLSRKLRIDESFVVIPFTDSEELQIKNEIVKNQNRIIKREQSKVNQLTFLNRELKKEIYNIHKAVFVEKDLSSYDYPNEAIFNQLIINDDKSKLLIQLLDNLQKTYVVDRVHDFIDKLILDLGNENIVLEESDYLDHKTSLQEVTLIGRILNQLNFNTVLLPCGTVGTLEEMQADCQLINGDQYSLHDITLINWTVLFDQDYFNYMRHVHVSSNDFILEYGYFFNSANNTIYLPQFAKKLSYIKAEHDCDSLNSTTKKVLPEVHSQDKNAKWRIANAQEIWQIPQKDLKSLFKFKAKSNVNETQKLFFGRDIYKLLSYQKDFQLTPGGSAYYYCVLKL
jgi:hypothetical protein